MSQRSDHNHDPSCLACVVSRLKGEPPHTCGEQPALSEKDCAFGKMVLDRLVAERAVVEAARALAVGLYNGIQYLQPGATWTTEDAMRAADLQEAVEALADAEHSLDVLRGSKGSSQ